MKTIINTSSTSDILSPIEKEVLHLMAYDYTMDEMCLELNLKEDEVSKLHAEIMIKFEAEHESAMIRIAYERRILLLYEHERAKKSLQRKIV